MIDGNRLKTARLQASLVKGRSDWYRINNLADRAEVYIYDEIGYFGITAQDFVRELQGLSAPRIDLHLNTPGGEVFDGIAIYTALKSHKAQVTVIVDSLAASIGSVIAQAGDQRLMTRNAQMMIHDGHGLCIGNAADMRELAALLDKTSDNIASIYAERAGGSTSQWRNRMRAETWYTAEEAVKAGLADAIHGETTTENSWDLSIFTYKAREEAPEPELVPSKESTQENLAFEFDPDLFKSAFKELVKT